MTEYANIPPVSPMRSSNMTETKRKRGRKRSDLVADQIKGWIAAGHFAEGDTLPKEAVLVERCKAARSTIREALKSLEVEGLIQLKTGPKGGAISTRVSSDRTIELMGNYFFSQPLSLADVYAVRKTIEPQMAEACVGFIDEQTFRALRHTIGVCACDPAGILPGSRVRIAELDFHDILAEACPNKLLGLYSRLISGLLKSLAVCTQLYEEPRRDLGRRGYYFHSELVDAFVVEDKARVRKLMTEHVNEAESFMREYGVQLERRLMTPFAEVQEDE